MSSLGTDKIPNPKVALVHDFLLNLRGAERVFLAISEIWPQADIFTAVYSEEGTEGRFQSRNIKTSFLQPLKLDKRNFRLFLPFYRYAIETLDLSDYDLVISSSSAWAHGVLVDEGAVHLSYCHNPFRYAWSDREHTLKTASFFTKPFLAFIFHSWRQWDWLAAQRVDHYIANSKTTEARIEHYFNRKSTVLYPPVETDRFSPKITEDFGDYYLLLSELMSHKRLEVAVEAFNQLGKKLVVIGDGPSARKLKLLAKDNIQFVGRVSDQQVAELLSGCAALIVTATEEFGIAAVEAQAAGRPVIAYAQGGVCETVIDGQTGTFYGKNTPQELASVVDSFDVQSISPKVCTKNAERFNIANFQKHFKETVQNIVNEKKL